MADQTPHSIRKLLPTFRISVGTQVVLRVNKLNDQGGYRPRGSVGMVKRAPTDTPMPYVVAFADGEELEAEGHELSVRRREVEDELVRTGVRLEDYVIYRCQVGSHAFGLATEDSDDDVRGIYLPPARLHWSLYRLPEEVERSAGGKEEVYWELEKFVRLALKANPNVLEVLWSPRVLHANDVAKRLLSIRESFLSRLIYQTYSGYVLSQFRRMTNAYARTGTYRAKHAMHLIRLLYSGVEALRHGTIRMDVGDCRDELLAIKSGKWTFEQARERALELDRAFQEAYAGSSLPERPDYGMVDEFLVGARRRMVDA